MTDKQAKMTSDIKRKWKKRRKILKQQSPLPLKNKESLFYLLAMARVRPDQELGGYFEGWDIELGVA